MTPLQMFIEWLQSEPLTAGFELSRGMWVEDQSSYGTRFVAVMQSGGRSPGVVERYPQFRVVAFGRRGERGDVVDLERYAHALVARSIDGACFNAIANVRSMADVTGPGYTTEDRPWYSAEFELII